ncbi:hypothetical protein O6H91_04G077600 [Diphasiastrum complanatum]|nr:hypothetical protein O6H91_04G077600 [Diphasiastrum complanatum]
MLQYLNREVLRMKQQIERAHQTQRHMMGEDLAILPLKDLQQLEEQLDIGLRHIRAKKDQLLLEQLEELRRKERHWLEENEALRRKLAGGQALSGPVPSPLSIVNPLETREPPSLGTVSLPFSVQFNQQNMREAPNLQTSLQLG